MVNNLALGDNSKLNQQERKSEFTKDIQRRPWVDPLGPGLPIARGPNETSTYYQHAQTDADFDGKKGQVVGAGAKYPAASCPIPSFLNGPDPLGYAIDEQVVIRRAILTP